MPAERGRVAFASLGRRLASLLVLIAAWWGVAFFSQDQSRFPGPVSVAAFALHESANGAMLSALAITLARVAAAFVLSMSLGIVIGVVAGRSRTADTLIDPWLVVAINLPVLVVVVLTYVWIGLNDLAAIVAVSIAKIPTVVVTIREGARALDAGFDELAEVFALSRLRSLQCVVLPQMGPYLVAAARGGLSTAWKIMLVVELLGRPSGVGFELNLLFQTFDVVGILAYGLVFALVMLALETLVMQPLENRISGWR